MFLHRLIPLLLDAYDSPRPFSHRRPAPGERAYVPCDLAAGAAERVADRPSDGGPGRAPGEGRRGPAGHPGPDLARVGLGRRPDLSDGAIRGIRGRGRAAL